MTGGRPGALPNKESKRKTQARLPQGSLCVSVERNGEGERETERGRGKEREREIEYINV